MSWLVFFIGSGVRPVFLIGFPRSGTTLLDTILRSHPSVEVLEEIPLINYFIENLESKFGSDLNELGIKILWAGTNADESKVYDVTEVKDPSKFEVLTKRDDITKKRADAGVELESQEVIDTISKDYWA